MDDALPPGPAPSRAWVTLVVALLWLGLHVAGLVVSGAPLESDHVFTWAAVPPELQIRHGALVPSRVTGGEWQRVITGAAVAGQGALGLALALFMLAGAGRALERIVGSWRTLVVVTFAVAVGGVVRVLYDPESRFPHVAGWDLTMGLVGARVPLGLALGGREGRTLVSGAFAYVAFVAVLAFAIPGTPASHLWGEGAAFVGGALAVVLLGPRRSFAPPGTLTRLAGVATLAFVLVAAGLQARTADASGSDPAWKALLASLDDTEEAARLLWKARDPTRVVPGSREDLGRQLDDLSASSLLKGFDGADAFRAYLESMRPLATGDLRDPTAVLARLKAGYRTWAPHEDALRRRLGRLTRAVPPWR
jgi:hypothetical protein